MMKGTLDLFSEQATGAELRDIGMKQAIDHAEQETPSWADQTYKALVVYIDCHPHHWFMGEDIRAWISDRKMIPEPPHLRAWGGVIAKAARKNLIRCVGTRSVTNRTAHCANAAIWRRVDSEN